MTEIPVIDLEGVEASSVRGSANHDLREEFLRCGAFFVISHGVTSGVIRDAYSAAAALHDLPRELKLRVAVGVIPLARGWHEGRTAGKGAYETFEIGSEANFGAFGDRTGILHGPNVWPDLAGFQEAATAYFDAVSGLALRLIPLIADVCDVDADYFYERLNHPCQLLRMLNYEGGGPEPAGINPHTDFELLTILSETDTGLEVCRRDGDWVPVVPPVEDALLVMAGDMLELVTGGLIESPLHRVETTRPRRSLAYFLGLDAGATISPQRPVTVGHDAALYAPIQVGSRLAGMHILSYPHLRRLYEAGVVDVEIPEANPFKRYKLDRLNRQANG